MQPLTRRTFGYILAGIAAAPPRPAVAQGAKVRRIGWLDYAAPDPPHILRVQADKPRGVGWIEGENLQIERRHANGHPDALPSLAEELVRARVELIVTFSSPATLAAKRVTDTIPIIFGSAGEFACRWELFLSA